MQTTDDILFSAHGPDPIPTATTEIVGTPGNARNVYWIVSHFPIGSVVSGPFPQKDSPNVLDDENYVHISWPATLGASSYDLLFTRELQLPRQPGRFLLAANLTSTEFRDTGQDLDLYDLAGIRYGAPQQEWIYFDNRDRKQPTLRFIPWPIEVSSIIFEDGSSQNTAGGGGQPAGSDTQIQFNNEGAFGASPNLTWINDTQDLIVNDAFGRGVVDIGPTQINMVARYGGGIFITVPPFYSTGSKLSFSVSEFILGSGGGNTINSEAPLNLLAPGPTFLTMIGGNVGIGTQNPQATLDVTGDINTSSQYRINGVSFAAPYLTGPAIALSNVTRIESPSSGVTVNAGANAIQFLFGASNTVILSSGFADFYGVFTRIFGLFQVQNALTVFDNGNIEMTNLPSADPGVGSKRIWYDPANSNIVKYAP